MRAIICILSFFIFCNACKDKKKEPELNLDAITAFISSFDSNYYKNYEKIDLLEKYDNHSDENKLKFVFILNATCSSCIVEFFTLYDIINNAKLDIPIYCFLQESYKVNLEYYVEQLETVHDNLNIKEIEDRFFQNEKELNFGDIFISYDNKHVARLFLHENEITLVPINNRQLPKKSD